MGRELKITDVSAPCCTPMVADPLSAASATELAKAFMALGDPVRLRLLSLIAARAGGEICVCDLTDAFDVSGRPSPTT